VLEEGGEEGVGGGEGWERGGMPGFVTITRCLQVVKEASMIQPDRPSSSQATIKST